MSKQDKALERLLARPKDFSWTELLPLMRSFGYELKTTGGSGRKFVRPGAAFALHEPHPQKLLKAYQLRALILFLQKEGDL